MTVPSSDHGLWFALNEEELAIENSGDKIAKELAEAREKTAAAVAKANLLIHERRGSQAELARIRAELERLRAILEWRVEDRPRQREGLRFRGRRPRRKR
jgi:C4-dicarboxylate-specific signal transduction histidine kinase